ncbi:MAG: hypothetical protein IJL53_00880 [Firmicutes bacterium]|nr:hypothetical protein [Bacillota bacterium]
MRSDIIAVSNGADKIGLVLKTTERVAAYGELSPKSAMYLRLMAEEMMSMVRAITGSLDGKFWIENEDDNYELHLRVQSATDYDIRQKLISASSSGVNEAHKGFMGKIRAFFEPVDDLPVFTIGFEDEEAGAGMEWSMRAYALEIERSLAEKRAGAEEAWDELEKSVITHVADEIKVSIKNSVIEMTVYKKLA